MRRAISKEMTLPLFCFIHITSFITDRGENSYEITNAVPTVMHCRSLPKYKRETAIFVRSLTSSTVPPFPQEEGSFTLYLQF